MLLCAGCKDLQETSSGQGCLSTVTAQGHMFPCQHWDRFRQFDPRTVAPNPWGFRESVPHKSFSASCAGIVEPPGTFSLKRWGGEKTAPAGDISPGGSTWRNTALRGGTTKGLGAGVCEEHPPSEIDWCPCWLNPNEDPDTRVVCGVQPLSTQGSRGIQGGEEGNTMPEPPEKDSRAREWSVTTSSLIPTKPDWKAWCTLWSYGQFHLPLSGTNPTRQGQCSSCGRTDQSAPSSPASQVTASAGRGGTCDTASR